MKRTLVWIAALSALVAACGDDGGTVATDPSDSTTVPTTRSSLPPLDADQRILEIRSEGGFAPPEFLFSRVPAYTLYGDGRLVYESPVVESYPGPLMPILLVADVGTDGLEKVQEAIEAAGLPDVANESNRDAAAIVADAPDTVITYTDDAGDHVYSVYALSIAVEEEPSLQPLQDLLDLLGDLANESDAEVYPVDTVQVVVSQDFGGADEPEAVVERWPFATPAADAPDLVLDLKCFVVEGDDLTTVLPTLNEATQLTFFEDGEVTYRLTLRPLLSGEEGCVTEQ